MNLKQRKTWFELTTPIKDTLDLFDKVQLNASYYLKKEL